MATTRLSIEERYRDHADYVSKMSHVARSLVEERYLLPEDADRIIEAAKISEIGLTRSNTPSREN